MVHRNFIQKREGLNRDADGHRTGFKFMLKRYRPMSKDGFDRWSAPLKVHIGKHQTVQKFYTCNRDLGYDDGVPEPLINCKTNDAFGKWLITYAGCGEGEKYGLYSWRGKSSKKNAPAVLTKQLATIEILSVDKMVTRFTKFGRLSRYWFRRSEDKNKHKERE